MIDATVLQSPAQAAHAFRAILASLSKPANPVSIAAVVDAPLPLLPAAASLVLTLADYQTPIWLCSALNVDAVRKYLRFHTGAPITTDPAEAVFAILTVDEAAEYLPDFNVGSHEYPDRSTTVIVQASGFTTGDLVTVSGPGLKQPARACVAQASKYLWQHIQNNNSLFPIGNDFVFASTDAIMSIPRSSQIEFMEAT